MLEKMRQNRNPYILLVGMQISTTTTENRFFKKLKIEMLQDPEIPLLSIYSKECKSA
jgi:hypothetical protein